MAVKALVIHIINEDGIYRTLEDSGDSIAEELGQHGIKAEIFHQIATSNIIELAEDISGCVYDHLVFVVAPDTCRLMDVLAQKLFEEDGQTSMIWFSQQELGSVPAQVILVSDMPALVRSLLSPGGDNSRENTSRGPAQETHPGIAYSYIMQNGYIAFQTGMYPFDVLGVYTKHIGYDGSAEDEGAGYLDEYLNLNSAVIAKKDQFSSHDYQDYMHSAAEQGVFIPHYHQDTGDALHFDDSEYCLRKEECSYLDFAALKHSGRVDPELLYVLSVSSGDDLACLLADVEEYENNGRIAAPNFILVDECRWGRQCNLKHLPRMHVNRDGTIRPCLECDETIGTVRDIYYKNIRNSAKYIDKAFIARGCNDCALKPVCSKCAMLPEFLNEKQYCSARRSHPMLIDYLDKKNVLQYLVKYTGTLSSVDTSNIRISSFSHTFLFPNSTKSEWDAAKSAYLMYVGESPILFDYSQQSLLKIDSRLAFILEGYIKNHSEEQTIHYFSAAYGTDSRQSRETVVNGMEFLRNAGVVA